MTLKRHQKDVNMTIKRKVIKAKQNIEHDIDTVIQRGGNNAEDRTIKTQGFRLTLRGPSELMYNIDKSRKNRLGNISRNQWILEAIEEKLNNKLR